MKRSELKQIIREVIEESKLIQEFGPLASPSRGSTRVISKSPRRKTKITVEYDYVPQNENFYTIRNTIGMDLIHAEKPNETKDKSVRNTTFILDYVLSDREEFELDKKLQKLLNDVIINEYEFNSTVEESKQTQSPVKYVVSPIGDGTTFEGKNVYAASFYKGKTIKKDLEKSFDKAIESRDNMNKQRTAIDKRNGYKYVVLGLDENNVVIEAPAKTPKETIEESIEPGDEYADLSPLEARKLIKSKLKELEQLDLSSEELEKVSTMAFNDLEEEDEVHGKLNKAIIIAASILSLMTITSSSTSDADFAKFLHKNVETTEHTGKNHQTKKEKSDEKASLYSSKLNDSRKRDEAADHRQLAQSINRIWRV